MATHSSQQLGPLTQRRADIRREGGIVETPPLAFADVLERESVRLHGPGQSFLPGRWEVTPDEILDARTLIGKLAPRLVARTVPRPSRWGRRGGAGEGGDKKGRTGTGELRK